MRTGCYPDDITACPACKRDDKASFRLGRAGSPFTRQGGALQCRCGFRFVAGAEKEAGNLHEPEDRDD